MAPTPTWKGGKALRRMIVPIESLEPFPGNPRTSDISAITESLGRFGQVRPVLIDGQRIIAGHHVVLAATELGWTHVAVVANEFRDEDEQRAYLIADNRIPELGGYDAELMAAQLRALAEVPDGLRGTGFSPESIDAQLAALRALASAPVIAARAGKREHRDPGMKELVLNYSEAQLEQVEVWLGIVAHEKGTAGTSETVYEGLRAAAQALNA